MKPTDTNRAIPQDGGEDLVSDGEGPVPSPLAAGADRGSPATTDTLGRHAGQGEGSAKITSPSVSRRGEPSPPQSTPQAMGGWKLVPLDDDRQDHADSILPLEMIEAGQKALDKCDDDLRDYKSGETPDWDNHMIAVAVYRAMTAAAGSPAPSSAKVIETSELKKHLDVLGELIDSADHAELADENETFDVTDACTALKAIENHCASSAALIEALMEARKVLVHNSPHTDNCPVCLVIKQIDAALAQASPPSQETV